MTPAERQYGDEAKLRERIAGLEKQRDELAATNALLLKRVEHENHQAFEFRVQRDELAAAVTKAQEYIRTDAQYTDTTYANPLEAAQQMLAFADSLGDPFAILADHDAEIRQQARREALEEAAQICLDESYEEGNPLTCEQKLRELAAKDAEKGIL